MICLPNATLISISDMPASPLEFFLIHIWFKVMMRSEVFGFAGKLIICEQVPSTPVNSISKRLAQAMARILQIHTHTHKQASYGFLF